MAEEIEQKQAPKLNPDWFVRGVLTKLGDTFDRLTGRGWKPSSSLATSGLIERLKLLLDEQVRTDEDGRRYVPHNIKLKMQWDKFSTDSETALRSLEHELLTAAVDHINDRLYYTYAPLSLEVKPDYFTSGVKLFVSFDTGDQTSDDEAELAVSVPGMRSEELLTDVDPNAISPAAAFEIPAIARFTIDGREQTVQLRFQRGKRLSVGRTRENDLTVDHTSVSKAHGSLMLDEDRRLVVADTGSTNGTFINGQRIAYGKAMTLDAGDRLQFGSIEVKFDLLTPTGSDQDCVDRVPEAVPTPKQLEETAPASSILRPIAPPETELASGSRPAPPTQPSIDLPHDNVEKNA